MKRTIGVWGVVSTLIGYVIGASIFILPGALAGSAGPAVVISYSLAAVIAVFSCLAAAQLGTVFPRTGAGYITVAKLVSPMAGFIGIWLMLAAYILAIALIAIGFSEYFVAMFPSVDPQLAIYGVVLVFVILNMMNVNFLVGIQGALVIFFMVALFIVSAGGITSINTDNLSPFLPLGWDPVLLAVVPAFFSYGGFMAVMEMAGEIKNPQRTIPISMMISFVLVLIMYITLALVLVGMVPWQELATLKAPVRVIAGQLFPGWGATLVGVAVLGAAATSINALMLVASRDVIALARSGKLPSILDCKQGAKPISSVTFVGFFAIGALLLGETVTEYAIWVSSSTLMFQMLIALALIAVPEKAEEVYQNSSFKLGLKGIKYCGYGLFAISGFFLFLVLSDTNNTLIAALGYIAVGLILYKVRIGKGKDLEIN